jgi:DNA invertase Pin-like site-specific DNA recombinase
MAEIYGHRRVVNSGSGGAEPKKSAFALPACPAHSHSTPARHRQLMLAVIGAVGQAEREAALECRRERIAKAKREGRYEGSVPTARRQRSSVRGPLAARPRESRQAWYQVGQRLSGLVLADAIGRQP